MGKNLNDIKKDIALLTLYIKLLDPASKHSAIVHLFEESIGLLKSEHNLDKVEQSLPKDKSELLLKDDKEDTWIFNNDTFVDDIGYESNKETAPVQEKESSENKSSIEPGKNEERDKGLHKTPQSEIKEEPANQQPDVISLNPGTFHGKIANEYDMIREDIYNLYT